ncbi:MAG: ABC transporter permease [Jatrophihabitans sp.]|uniref:ABC transporter permease n=1 Tax=Jatrophihabitans sp. TaxID=1932789 RepID=UPI003F7D0517
MTLPAGELQVAADEAGPAFVDVTEQGGQAIAGRSLGQIAWRRLRRDKVAIGSAAFIVLLILVAVFANPLCHWYGAFPNTIHNTPPGDLLDPSTQMPVGSFGGASSDHWLGVTPALGNDVLANLIYGARTSLLIGLLATLVAVLLGTIAGVAAGFYGGVTDSVLSRLMDLLLSFPVLLFSIALLAIFGDVPSFAGLSGVPLHFAIIIFVLGFFTFPYIGRIVRGQVLSIREKEYIDAARSLGASNWRIMTREILPNLVASILVYSTLAIPNNILGEAGLSFLGVGVPPQTPSWGKMLSDANQYFQIDPLYLFAPGIALFLTVLAFNLFGDGLRDALDPRSRR